MKQNLEKTTVSRDHISLFLLPHANHALSEWWHEKGQCGVGVVVSPWLILTKKIEKIMSNFNQTNFRANMLSQQNLWKEVFFEDKKTRNIFPLKQWPRLFPLWPLAPTKILDYWETLQIFYENNVRKLQSTLDNSNPDGRQGTIRI